MNGDERFAAYMLEISRQNLFLEKNRWFYIPIRIYTDAPLPLGNPIDRFGYELGRPGIITVEIDANPKPRLEWRVRGETLKEGGVDSTGRVQAEFAQELVSIR